MSSALVEAGTFLTAAVDIIDIYTQSCSRTLVAIKNNNAQPKQVRANHKIQKSSNGYFRREKYFWSSTASVFNKVDLSVYKRREMNAYHV